MKDPPQAFERKWSSLSRDIFAENNAISKRGDLLFEDLKGELVDLNFLGSNYKPRLLSDWWHGKLEKFIILHFYNHFADVLRKRKDILDRKRMRLLLYPKS